MNGLPDLAPLANFGALGLVLGWFLFNTSPRLERIERSIDILSKTILLDMVSRPNIDATVKVQAESLARQLDDKYRSRGGSTGGLGP